MPKDLPYKEGDKVTCTFIPPEQHIVRTITAVRIIDHQMYIAVDGGAVCPSCLRTGGTPISLIAPSWYQYAE